MPVLDLPVRLFKTRKSWESWLARNFDSSKGVWMRIAKKSAALKSVTYPEAVEVALCHGWIDGQRRGHDEDSFLQRFTPRGPRSIWSKINREKALEMIADGRMQRGGLAAIERAKQNGQWEAAYDSYRTAEIPEELRIALDRNPKAKKFFDTLSSRHRFGISFRVKTAKREETRKKRIADFLRRLEKHEKPF